MKLKIHSVKGFFILKYTGSNYRWLFVLVLLVCSFTAEAQYDKNYFFIRGRQYIIENRFPQAISNFNTLLSADSTLYEAYFFRGIAKYNLNDYIGALGDFDKTLSINPVYTQAYHYRAITRGQLGRYDEALSDLDETLDLRPNYTGVYFSRGIIYMMSQQFENAMNDFNRYLRFEPKSGDAYTNRGTCFLLLKDTVSALDDYNLAVKLSPFDPDAFVRRSRVYALQGHTEQALTDLNRAIELDSMASYSYFNRALIRYELKDVNGALADLSRVLDLDPDNALTYYNRALIYTQVENWVAALKDYQKVIEINPNNVLVYFNRAAVFAETNRYTEALNDYTEAIRLYPDFANAYLNRSYVKTQLGMLASAKKDYEVAQQKIAEHRLSSSDSISSIFSDTSRQFNKLLALDADFAKKNFDSDLLQDRKVDITLRPMFRFASGVPHEEKPLRLQYTYAALNRFLRQSSAIPLEFINNDYLVSPETLIMLDSVSSVLVNEYPSQSDNYFYKAIAQGQMRQYTSALNYYTKAISLDSRNAFYYINRSILQAEMIDFIATFDDNVAPMTVNNSGSGFDIVKPKKEIKINNYKDAIADLDKAQEMAPDFTYIYYNRGNLRCLSNQMPEAIDDYTKAIQLYPNFGEAYYNRGLVQIYLRDTEKGCLDVSKSGELGVDDAYSVIKKYCLKEDKE